MNTELKNLYGRRITPGVRIIILVVLILLGLHLVFTEAKSGDWKHEDKQQCLFVEPKHCQKKQ